MYCLCIRIRNSANLKSRTLADEILPQLRRARLTANYEVIGRSDEEINAAFDAKEDSISVDELLYAATLTNDNARKEAIYKRTIEKYPNDYRAYNNLGMMAYMLKTTSNRLQARAQALLKLTPTSVCANWLKVT